MSIPSPDLSAQTLVVPAARWLLRPVPKASSTLLKRLAVLADGRTPPEQAAFGETRPALAVHQPALHGLANLSQLEPALAQEALHADQWLRLAVIRHPAERLLSFWHDKLHLADPAYRPLNRSVQEACGQPGEKPCRFADFLTHLSRHWDLLKADGHLTPQVELLEPAAVSYSHRLDRDDLADRLPSLLQGRLAAPRLAAIRQELSRHERLYRQRLARRWEDAYSEDGLAVVAKHYGDDLSCFNYTLPRRRFGRVRPLAASDLDALVDPLQQLRDRNNQIAGLQSELAQVQQQLVAALQALEKPPLPSIAGPAATWPPHNAPEAGLGHLYDALAEQRHQEVLDQVHALGDHPHAGEVAYLAGLAQHLLGQHETALRLFERAQSLGFLTPYVLFNGGNACRAIGNSQEGIRLYREALAIFPDFLECRHNLALAFLEVGDAAEAERVLRLLLRDHPEAVQAAFCLGNLLRDNKRPAEAIEAFHLCLQFAPTYPDAWNNLGLTQASLGRHDEAIASYRQALSCNAEFRASRQNLAQALVHNKRHSEALREFEIFANLADLSISEQVLALQGRINCLLELDRHDEALALADGHSTDRRLQLMARLHVLPILFHSQEELAHVRQRWSADLHELYGLLAGLERCDSAWECLYSHAWSITNFYLAYQMGDDRPLQELYAGVLDRILRPRLAAYMQPIPKRDPADTSPLRIGVISPHLKNHNGAIWAVGWLEGLALNPGYQIFSYNLGEDEDSGTQRFAALGHYRHLPLRAESPEVGLQQILDDKLDLLIYTDIGMHPASKVTSVLQLAAVQAQGWGHPISSGSMTMDYFFGAEGMEPPGNEHHYSERLVRLPGTGLHYDVPLALHDGQRLYASLNLPEDRPLVLSLQSTFKYVPANDWTFAAVAAAHPQALILLVGHMGHGSIGERLQQRLTPHFEARGLDIRHHLRILPRLGYGDFMGLFAIAHHTIDTIDWNGGNSSFQSLSLDCPVVTFPTTFMRGRHTVAMLRELELPELIAHSREEYVAISGRLLTDQAFHAEIKTRIRERKQRLFHDKRVQEAFQITVETICR